MEEIGQTSQRRDFVSMRLQYKLLHVLNQMYFSDHIHHSCPKISNEAGFSSNGAHFNAHKLGLIGPNKPFSAAMIRVSRSSPQLFKRECNINMPELLVLLARE